jgi:hypothetical protein
MGVFVCGQCPASNFIPRLLLPARIPKRQIAVLDRMKVMSLNVKGGTPVYGPSLCETCERALTVKGYRENEKIVVCQAMWPEREVKFPVQECSSYTSKGRESLYEMKKIAWMLQPRGPKRQAGFIAPSHDDKEDSEIELVLDEES